jgi:3-hydroxyacyl-CoA dehydrogenase
MSDFVHYTIRDRVAVLTIDNPPVNALSATVQVSLRDAVARGDALAFFHQKQLTLAGDHGRSLRSFGLRVFSNP